ncbi:MAG: PCRF domain-containing protein, partial [Clostridia bacterium]|nr:PCRF domain-containing protein [Clostridia bacterium]
MVELEQYAARLEEARKKLSAVRDGLHVEQMEEELQELKEEQNAEGFWENLERSTHVNRLISTLQERIKQLERLAGTCDDIDAMMDLAKEENDEDMVAEAGQELDSLMKELDVLELETLMRGRYDQCDAVLSLHAGAGGTEAQDWNSMLYRMYSRYCERMGFTVKLLDILDGDEAGIKSVTFEVSGDHAYGYLRGEKGVHRLVRISPFDANARRHTSFASLDVAPMLEDDDSEIEIDMKYVRVDTYHSSGAGGQNVNKTSSAVRMTYVKDD